MKTQESICQGCKNKLHLKYLKLPFIFDKNTGEQIQGKEIQEYNCSCIYFNSRRESVLEKIIVTDCNQFNKI